VFIAATSQPTHSPTIATPQSLTDWGVAIAVLLWGGRKLLEMWQESQEKTAKLNDSLIDDLRAKEKQFVQEQGDVLKEVALLQKHFLSELKALHSATTELNAGYQMNLSQMRRETAVVVMEVRESHKAIADELTLINNRCNAIHRRLDETESKSDSIKSA
jgi:hypothetical protein